MATYRSASDWFGSQCDRLNTTRNYSVLVAYRFVNPIEINVILLQTITFTEIWRKGAGMVRSIKMAVAALTLLMFALPLAADTLVEIDRVRTDGFEVIGFELTKPAEVEIEAVGLRQSFGNKLSAYAWILDHETREPVWVMKNRFSSEYLGRASLRMVRKVKALDPGKYELYYYAGENRYGNIQIRGGKDLIGLLGDLFDEDDWDDSDDRNYDKYLDDCYVRISSDEASAGDIKSFEVTGDMPGALMSFSRLGDNEYIRQAFSLKKKGSLHIYSIIEHVRSYRTSADYSWIVNSDTREKVWEMDRFSTERAGGASKNRMFNDDITLEKGNYVLYFITDDSHSFEEFNAAPPYDPYSWGITVLPGEGLDPSTFQLTEIGSQGKPVIDLTRARDNDYVEQLFTLDKETTLRVNAIGEYSFSDREFVDYGWVQEAGSGKIVWEMTRRTTDHAGGADKNRMFDGIVTLPEGEYVAAYVTDGSHSYRDWNDRQPYDPRGWGLAVYPGPGEDASRLKMITRDELTKDSNVLVSLIRARDNERMRKTFTLDDDTRVHIYAIGEGESGTMYDYAWIENDKTGRSVWEMTVRNTEHAGGARKNRMYDDDLLLDAGTYKVYYITDGSHSFNDWNSRRPSDPYNWGITVSVAP